MINLEIGDIPEGVTYNWVLPWIEQDLWRVLMADPFEMRYTD